MRCSAETQSGDRCTRNASDDADTCWQHSSARLLRLIEGGGEAAPEPEFETIADAAKAGDRRAAMANLRDRLARELDDPATAARDLASVSRRFLQVMEELEELDLRADEEPADDVTRGDGEWEAV